MIIYCGFPGINNNHPVTDSYGQCHPSFDKEGKRLYANNIKFSSSQRRSTPVVYSQGGGGASKLQTC